MPHNAADNPGSWDAETYDRLSDPQYAWGRRVLDRLALRGDETVVDAGCGTGRLTALLLRRVPYGRVIAVDQSASMVAKARENLVSDGDRIIYLCADLETIALAPSIDAIFSTATFHWILDHARLFRSLEAMLVPGGRLEAQCGGGPNLARLRARVRRLIETEPYAGHFQGWREPWLFASAPEAADELDQAGFVDIATSIEPAPTRFDSAETFRRFLQSVVLWPHLERLPEPLRDAFLEPLVAEAARDDDPFVLDYWRLNLRAQRPS